MYHNEFLFLTNFRDAVLSCGVNTGIYAGLVEPDLFNYASASELRARAATRALTLNCSCAIFNYMTDRIFYPERLGSHGFAAYSMAMVAITALGFSLAHMGLPAAASFIMAGCFLAGVTQYAIKHIRLLPRTLMHNVTA